MYLVPIIETSGHLTSLCMVYIWQGEEIRFGLQKELQLWAMRAKVTDGPLQMNSFDLSCWIHTVGNNHLLIC